ncbi:hypothetical protein RHGRI_033201 [Rhododendron griersonianum]|uniref:Jacalin-type lectin domain-containing protein n=1 Tax=Rhododendron griersonianum TaxID=479676 RepID=A0AAV6HYF1_9ERIC|nr:hypothetical protein RHGRI_033201 [Rhododendron griersonianum]
MFDGPEIWVFLMWSIPLVVSVIQAVRQPIAEDVIHRSVDALCGFVSGKLGRLLRFASQKKPQVVDLQKIEEELKTKIKEAGAENKVLTENNKAMEKKMVDLQKIEEELKTKIKEAGVENKVLKEKNEAPEKKLVQSPVPLSGQGSFGGQILSLTFEGKIGIIKSNISEEGGIALGPWGGNGGGYWAYKVDVAPTLEITLRYEQVINSAEQLSAISLTYGDWHKRSLVTSLSFYSNRGRYGPYGQQIGSTVSIPIEEGTILAGLHGRCGSYLDAFGVLVAPKASGSGLPLEEI